MGSTNRLLELLMEEVPLDSWAGDELIKDITKEIQNGKTVRLWLESKPIEVRLSKGKIEVVATTAQARQEGDENGT